jgi:hypothetical protein
MNSFRNALRALKLTSFADAKSGLKTSQYSSLASKYKINPTYKGRNLVEGGDAWRKFIREKVVERAGKVKAIASKKRGSVVIPTDQNVIVGGDPTKKKSPLKLITKKSIQKTGVFEKQQFYYSGISDLKDLFNAINRNKKGAVNFILMYQAIDSNKVLGRTLPISYAKSYKEFERAIEEINTRGLTGSDPLNESDYDLLFEPFYMTYVDTSGFSRSDDIIFKCEGIKSMRKVCGWECMKKCGWDKSKPEELLTLENIMSVIQENNLPINVVLNTIHLHQPHDEIIKGKECVKHFYKNKKGYEIPTYRKRIYEGLPLEPVYCHKVKEAQHTIIYDEFNKHFDISVGEKLEYEDNIYLTAECKVMKDDRILFTPKQIVINKLKKEELVKEVEYLFFDYETIIDFDANTCMREYSVSILRLTEDELIQLEKDDMNERKDKIDLLRKNKCITFMGYDCSEQFIKWLIENQADKKFVFVGFNNCNFDNIILLNAFLKHNEHLSKLDYKISSVFYSGSSLLNFWVNETHECFDIHKHLLGSLKNNCDSFKIKCCKKLEFSHDKAQQLHKEGKLMEFIMTNEELKTYNEFDVLATAVLFQKYRIALTNIPATEPYAKELHSTKTIGSLIWKVFSDTKKQKGYELPKLELQEYKDLQSCKIAGRVELFNGVQKIEERMVSTDVCSLYPYVMSIHNCYYPCGKIERVSSYKGADTIGFYYCDIDQSCLKDKNLPNIYAYKTEISNEWDYEGVIGNYLLSNIMIELLLKYGCKVDIRNGFIFSDKKKSCDMFDFLLDFMKAKNEQDTFNKQKNPNYNPALRETLKLLMNSLSGKVIEGLHTEKTTSVDNVKDFLEIEKKATSINYINIVGESVFLTYEVSEESLIKDQRPIYLGVLIYDYAKRYMYEMSYSKIGKDKLFYTDTDASKFRHRDFEKWYDWVKTDKVKVPCWEEVYEVDARYRNHLIYDPNSKVFGSFEDELADYEGDEYLFYCLEKKSWSYSWCKGKEWKSKFKFKGINGRSQILTLNEEWIDTCIKNKKDGGKEIYYRIGDGRERDVYEYYTANTDKNIEEGNVIRFFNQIYETGEAYVLCSSFRKIVKNTLHGVGVEDTNKFNNDFNRIKVCFQMKHLKIKSKEDIKEDEDCEVEDTE